MLARILPRKFYARPSIVVAPDLIGKVLVRDVAGSRLEGIIVETEAYAGLEDPASHAYRGKTKSTIVTKKYSMVLETPPPSWPKNDIEGILPNIPHAFSFAYRLCVTKLIE